jgi:surfactin family lipopeptide synthetase A
MSTTELFSSLLTYWKAQLEGAPTVLQLPTDKPRKATKTFQGASWSFLLPEPLMRALKALCKREYSTPFMVLLAAFQVLLYRYTGQEDFLIGIPIKEAQGQEERGLLFFTYMVVLRATLSHTLTFRELLALVRERVSEAYAHQELSFDRLVDELQPQHDQGFPPLVQVLFLQHNILSQTPDPPVISSEGDRDTAQFDLAFELLESPQELRGRFTYSTALFEAATIERMGGYLQCLLEGLVADPTQPICTLPLLTDVERHQLLVAWNQTSTDYPREYCVHQLFEAQVACTPDAVALVYEEESLTYDELNCRANRVAHHLQKLGVRPEELVGICMERSVEMLVGLLGVLKAGGAYVPLDPTYPAERLAFMLEDAGVQVLLTQKRLIARLPKHQAQDVCLDTGWEHIVRESADTPVCSVTGANLAYVIYTSGSTGKPKGVAMCHRPLCNLLAWQLQSTALSEGARTLQFASLSFDVSFQEIFSTWCSGGTLVLLAEELRRDMEQMLHLLNKESIARLFLPFVALQQLAEVADSHKLVPTHLCAVITAGEQLQITSSIRRLFDQLKGCTLYNHYGPSESHVATAFTLEGFPEQWPSLPPIGRPIANTQIYLLDEHQQPVPVGLPGELYIGGAGLARGYLNRPELTAERFITNPFCDEPGARLYRTGDMARYRSDGTIEFLGRLDQQVKIRGFRIEIGEIEATLSGHPGVREAAVLARELAPGEKRLVAYVVPHERCRLSSSELRGFLKERLPEYMVPSFFILLESLPLTPSGKIDRRTLSTLALTKFHAEETSVGARNPLEETLAEIWAAVLGLRQVGIHDNFFELGGDSLLATRITAQVSRTFQVEVPLHTLFALPTIAEYALAVEEKLIEEIEDLPEEAVQEWL